MGILMTGIESIVVVLTITAFLFQFHKTITHKDASGISYLSQTVVAIGSIIWLMFSGAKQQIAPGLVNIFIMIPLLITLHLSLKDNGVRKWVTFVLPIVLGVLAMGAIIFFILGAMSVFSGDWLNIVGFLGIFIGGTFTSCAFMPQTIKTLKSKNVGSLSLAMTTCYSVAQTLWVVFFSVILYEEFGTSTIDNATNIWAVITAVIPMFVQYLLLYAILKWGQKSPRKVSSK